MSFREFIEELKSKEKEGFKELVVKINGKSTVLKDLKSSIETFQTMDYWGYNLIETKDLFIVNGENGQVILTDNVPF